MNVLQTLPIHANRTVLIMRVALPAIVMKDSIKMVFSVMVKTFNRMILLYYYFNCIVDINECALVGTCGEFQDCNNTMGSFQCACQTGLVLNDTTEECEGAD